jgi:hypothetical protein
MAGLDPAIHDEGQHVTFVRINVLRGLMDCRLKAGNDAERADE